MISRNMITETSHYCDLNLIKDCIGTLKEIETPLVLNEPTGDFFTDPWLLKKEFKNSVWEKIYFTLKEQVGQARIISLDPATCYHCHSDIDDRYHLNLVGEESYLVDLTDRSMYKIENDGQWYSMDASRIHSAVNFGRYTRYQLVVRKLLLKNHLEDPLSIKIISSEQSLDDARFIFDNTISPWLNISYKKNMITNFRYEKSFVCLDIEKSYLHTLHKILPNNMKVEIYD